MERVPGPKKTPKKAYTKPTSDSSIKGAKNHIAAALLGAAAIGVLGADTTTPPIDTAIQDTSAFQMDLEGTEGYWLANGKTRAVNKPIIVTNKAGESKILQPGESLETDE